MTALQRVAHLVGVPYQLHGETTEAWDCLGCARHVRTAIFGRPWRSDGVEYGFRDAQEAASRARLISGRLGEWEHLGDKPADMRPGAVLLFQYFGSPSHVAVALTPRDFIHCIGGVGTTIVDFDREPQWERRLRGVYD